MKNFVLGLCSRMDCETGEKEVEKGIGVCSAFPGSTPANVSACYSYNGSCYVCDNSKDYIDCNADWLWNYNFPTHSWFKQVDCYDPFGEEDEGECVDDGLFKIQEPSDNENFKIENSYSVNFTSPIKYYDLLGRNLNKSKFSKNRMLVGVRDNRINAANQKEHIVFYIPARHLIAQTVEKCGVLYGDYGIKNGNGHDLGVYCGYPYYEYTKDSVRVDLSKDMFGRKCDNGKGRYEAVVRVSFNPILQNDYYKVVGSTFKYDGVIVRSSLRDSIARHEFGHKYYANHCWLDTAKVQEVMVVIDSICEPEVVCEGRNQSLKSLKKIAQDSVTNRLDKLAISYANNPKNDLRKLCGWYHGKYSTSNGPSDTTNTSSLVCPDLNDPSIKYEYSGCQ